jgi:hypothetical protein
LSSENSLVFGNQSWTEGGWYIVQVNKRGTSGTPPSGGYLLPGQAPGSSGDTGGYLLGDRYSMSPGHTYSLCSFDPSHICGS